MTPAKANNARPPSKSRHFTRDFYTVAGCESRAAVRMCGLPDRVGFQLVLAHAVSCSVTSVVSYKFKTDSMTDHFALLNEPRRPWLDPDALRRKFLSLSAAVHPDKVQFSVTSPRADASRQFAELNAAYNCLREPKERLRHLLGLELGSRPKDLQQIPSDLADLFMEIGALCKQVDGFLAEKARTSSLLLRAQMFERGQEWVTRLTATQGKVNERHNAIIAQLQSLDSKWMANTAVRSELLPQLEEVWRLLGFFTRWSSQLQERLAQIAF